MEEIHTTAVLLGKGVPNRGKGDKVKQCAIAVSPDIGLFRIYPLHPIAHKDLRQWSVMSISLTRCDKDQRAESYTPTRIEIIETLDERERRSLLDRCCLKSGSQDPQFFQNNICQSIYMVKPEAILRCSIERPERNEEAAKPSEEFWITTQNERSYNPKISWRSLQGSEHEQSVVAHGVSEFIRKSEYPMRVFENLRVFDDCYDKWFLCGNMLKHRNTWVIVNVFSLKKTPDRITPDFLPMFDGAGGAWPYLKQEAANVKVADQGQMEFSFTSTTSTTTSTAVHGNMATMSCRSYANTAIGEYTTNEIP